MTDRELLELAAKGCGMLSKSWYGNSAYLDGLLSRWNPQVNDGDAMFAAVESGIGMRFHDGWGEVFHPVVGCLEFKYGDDKRKATRYAITQLAAEIGKGMK